MTPDKPEDIQKVRDALAPMSPSGHRTVIDSAIDEVRNREEDTDKILSATRVVKLTMALLAGLLVLASLLLIANTIRLSLYARRREVEVMKLVGATDWFIRWPFVIEGVLVGALGGIVAVLLLGRAQGGAGRSAGGRLRADRGARHDELRAAHRRAARRRRRRLGGRLGHLAAPLPARLEPPFSPAGYTVPGLRRRRSLTPFVLALLPVLLVGGLWLGGHPQYLPGFVRDAFVGDSQAQLYQEAVDELADNYYRKVDRDKLLDTGLTAGVKSLDDRFSHYFDPKAYQEFEQSHRRRVRGRRHERRRDAEARRGLRVS